MTTNATFDRATYGEEVTEAYQDQINGRNVLITGVGPLGIGEGTLLAIAARKPNLITVTGRSATKVNESIATAKEKYPDANIRALMLDLSSLDAIRKAANEFLATPEPLHVIINNAGVMDIPERTLSPDGIEMQFATNHIGHFFFTNLIMPKLIEAAKTSPKGSIRIINTSSMGHMANPIRFSDWNWNGGEVPDEEKADVNWLTIFMEPDTTSTKYTGFGAYGQSKTANVLFSVGLNERLYEKHGILSLALHPGAIMSQLARHIMENAERSALLEQFQTTMFWKSKEQGASTQLVAAFDPKLNNWEKSTGYYLNDCQFQAPAPYAVDEVAAEKLWVLSEEIVKQKFEY